MKRKTSKKKKRRLWQAMYAPIPIQRVQPPKEGVPVGWEFKLLYDYLTDWSIQRKLRGRPTEGISAVLEQMTKAIKAGRTCGISYACGMMRWRWHVTNNCLHADHAYRFKPKHWDRP